MNWVDVCPVCGNGTRGATMTQFRTADYTTYGGAGSPAPGSWVCENCGSSNSDLTPDFCPICGNGR